MRCLVRNWCSSRCRSSGPVVSIRVLAATEWQRASVMTREAIALVAPDARSCAREGALLASPAASTRFRAISTTKPLPSSGMPRAEPPDLASGRREDAVVMVTRPAPGEIELRLPDYRGNAVASTDLSHFVVKSVPRVRVARDASGIAADVARPPGSGVSSEAQRGGEPGGPALPATATCLPSHRDSRPRRASYHAKPRGFRTMPLSTSATRGHRNGHRLAG